MENNKLIAEFIGMQKTDLGWFDNEEVLKLSDNTFDNLLFNTDWNWLMSVVTKINNMPDELITDTNYLVRIESKSCVILDGNRDYAFSLNKDSTIKATYETVLTFIKWHNEIAYCSVCKRLLMHDDECYTDEDTGEPLCDKHSRYDEVKGTYHKCRKWDLWSKRLLKRIRPLFRFL